MRDVLVPPALYALAAHVLVLRDAHPFVLVKVSLSNPPIHGLLAVGESIKRTVRTATDDEDTHGPFENSLLLHDPTPLAGPSGDDVSQPYSR